MMDTFDELMQNPYSLLARNVILRGEHIDRAIRLHTSQRPYTRNILQAENNGDRLMDDIRQNVRANISTAIGIFEPNLDDLYEYRGYREFAPALEDIPKRFAELVEQGVSIQEAHNIVTGMYDGPILWIDTEVAVKETVRQFPLRVIKKLAQKSANEIIDNDKKYYGAKQKNRTRREKEYEAEEREKLRKTTTLTDKEITTEIKQWREPNYRPGLEEATYPQNEIENIDDAESGFFDNDQGQIDTSNQYMGGSERNLEIKNKRKAIQSRIKQACKDKHDKRILLLLGEQLPATKFLPNGMAIPEYRTIEEVAAMVGMHRNTVSKRLAAIEQKLYTAKHGIQAWTGKVLRISLADFKEQTRRCFLTGSAAVAEASRVSGLDGRGLYEILERIEAVGWTDSIVFPEWRSNPLAVTFHPTVKVCPFVLFNQHGTGHSYRVDKTTPVQDRLLERWVKLYSHRYPNYVEPKDRPH